jgi:hypothetical protein
MVPSEHEAGVAFIRRIGRRVFESVQGFKLRVSVESESFLDRWSAS